MEEMKNQNDELQSRREFFKQAAKAALPILGVIVPGGAPQIINAATTPSNCSGDNCSYTCQTSCARECRGTCYSMCKDSCHNSSK